VLGRRAALDVTFLHPCAQDYPDPHTLELRTDTCYWTYGKQDAPGVEARRTGLLVTSYEHPRLVAVLSGWNCLLMAVMTPRGLNDQPPSVRPMTARGIMRAEVDLGDFVDTVIAAPDHGHIRQPDVEGNAQLALVRRDQAGKLVGTWTSDGAVRVKAPEA
jgi:hypothetical protein